MIQWIEYNYNIQVYVKNFRQTYKISILLC